MSQDGRSSAIWKRGAIMIVFMLLFGVAQSVLFAASVVQFLWMLFGGERSLLLAQFGYSLSIWLANTARFLTGDTEEKPFPWRPWPES